MAIEVTDAARQRISELLAQRGKPSVGIKVGVRSGGCSGLAYTIEYADTVGEYDEVVVCDKKTDADTDNGSEGDGKVKILIDPKAIMYLLGTRMDYVEEKLKSGFVFINPNEKGKCGCGESFHV